MLVVSGWDNSNLLWMAGIATARKPLGPMGWATGEKPMVMDPRIGGSSPGKSMGNSSSKALTERIRHRTTEPAGEFFYCHAFWPALPTCLFPFLPPKINLSHQGNGTFWVFHGTAGTSPYPSSSGMIPDTGHRWLCQQTWDMYWCLLISESQAWSIAPWSIIFTFKVTRTRCLMESFINQPRFFGQNSGKNDSTFKAPKLVGSTPHFLHDGILLHPDEIPMKICAL